MTVRSDGSGAYLPESIVDQVILAADALAPFRAAELRAGFSLTEIQYRLMLLAARHGPLNVSELASLVGRDRGQVSRTVKSLVDRQWMTSARLDKVANVEIALSAAGWMVMHEIAQAGRGWQLALGSALTDAETAIVSRTIDRLHAAVLGAGAALPAGPDDCGGHRPCLVAGPDASGGDRHHPSG
jgi:DNA-binding MarR family transcriptional regulator